MRPLVCSYCNGNVISVRFVCLKDALSDRNSRSRSCGHEQEEVMSEVMLESGKQALASGQSVGHLIQNALIVLSRNCLLVHAVHPFPICFSASSSLLLFW